MKHGTILSNEPLKSGYFMVRFYAPEVCKNARAGQFAHVRIEEHSQQILRRPFSIHEAAADGTLTIVYKVVGAGTERLSQLKAGDHCDIMGPLGNAYSAPEADEIPILVAGGYGSAAMYMLTAESATPGVALLGARSEGDVILADRYEKAGFEVQISTNDGSLGHQGFVTELIDPLLERFAGKKLRFYACGPHPMLMALVKLMRERGLDGEVSLDHLMCCGIGACFACVVKVNADNEQGWKYSRSCKDGPVFNVDEVYCP